MSVHTMPVHTSVSACPTHPLLHVVSDPPSGHVVLLPVGGRLELRFSRRGLSRWRIDGLPGHLVALEEGGWTFRFLVFGPPGGQSQPPLRLVRGYDDGSGAAEVREVGVVVTAR